MLNLQDIFDSQKLLDESIQNKYGVNYDKIYDELKLALFVELGELANEVRCFKFWSIRGPSEKKVILEEYVDGIHFICSLSITKGVDSEFYLPNHIALLSKKDLTICFNKLFSKMNTLTDHIGIKE
jgi:dimeric dUTPase (all-alpha-NTP-PPase superfamily)